MAVIAVMPATGAAPAMARSTPSGAGAMESSSVTVISSAQAPSVHDRVGVQDESVHVVARPVLAYGGAGLLHDACVVAAEGDGVLVLEAHAGEDAAGDRVVGGIGRGGVHAHDDLVVRRGGLGQALTQGGRRSLAINSDGSHGGSP
jgi:hypothetical protein